MTTPYSHTCKSKRPSGMKKWIQVDDMCASEADDSERLHCDKCFCSTGTGTWLSCWSTQLSQQKFTSVWAQVKLGQLLAITESLTDIQVADYSRYTCTAEIAEGSLGIKSSKCAWCAHTWVCISKDVWMNFVWVIHTEFSSVHTTDDPCYLVAVSWTIPACLQYLSCTGGKFHLPTLLAIAYQ